MARQKTKPNKAGYILPTPDPNDKPESEECYMSSVEGEVGLTAGLLYDTGEDGDVKSLEAMLPVSGSVE